MPVISKIVVVESYYLPRVYYLFTKNQVLSAMSWLEARKKIDFFFSSKRAGFSFINDSIKKILRPSNFFLYYQIG